MTTIFLPSKWTSQKKLCIWVFDPFPQNTWSYRQAENSKVIMPICSTFKCFYWFNVITETSKYGEIPVTYTSSMGWNVELSEIAAICLKNKINRWGVSITEFVLKVAPICLRVQHFQSWACTKKMATCILKITK